MNDLSKLVFRFQLIASNFRDEMDIGLYEVGVDPDTDRIVHISDPEPLSLSGSSVDEIMDILTRAKHDIKKYGIISYSSIEEEEETDEEIFYPEEIEMEDYILEKMEDMYDKEDKVLDLMDFMDRNR